MKSEKLPWRKRGASDHVVAGGRGHRGSGMEMERKVALGEVQRGPLMQGLIQIAAAKSKGKEPKVFMQEGDGLRSGHVGFGVTSLILL